MKGKIWTAITVFLILSVPIIVTGYGCSSGGGGGGGVSSGITYKGLTSPAIIDENNAVDIAGSSLIGGEIGSNLDVLKSVSETSETGKIPRVPDIASCFENVIHGIESSTQKNVSNLHAIQSESDTVTGSCGGSVSISLSADDQTGNFNGALDFNHYCEEGSTVNGKMSISGNIDVNMGNMNYLEMTFTNINILSGQESISMSGNIDFNLQSSTMLMTMSFVFKDNNLDKTFKYKDFVYEYTTGAGFTDVALTGRYYNPDYGYVDISTESPLRIYDTDIWPSSGIVTATGDAGTKARLTVIDSSSFFVEADTDGDGLYDDYTSGQQLWSEL